MRIAQTNDTIQWVSLEGQVMTGTVIKLLENSVIVEFPVTQGYMERTVVNHKRYRIQKQVTA